MMKTRQGFVSNSSSSSFLIVGIEKWESDKEDKLLNQLIKAAKIKDNWCSHGKNDEYEGEIVFLGDEEIYYAGIEIEDELRKGEVTVNKLRKRFVKLVKKELGVDIPLELVNLHFGECGGG